MADIERMQGRFDPPQPEGEMTVLEGSAPVINMRDYQKEIVSYTKGRGRFTCSVEGYEPCHNEQEVIESIGYDPETDLDYPTGSVFCSHGAGYLVPWNEVKNHMHIGCLLDQKKTVNSEAGTYLEREINVLENRPAAALPPAYASSGIDDKELEEIFIRTYGESKRKTTSQNGPRTVTYGAQRSAGPQEKVEEYLLVDGYNIIFAWEELRELAKATIDGARHKLMDILCNYQGYKKCTLIVVFDAYKVTGNTGEALDYHNIHVVYTKEAETADQYIEKLAHEMGKKYHVTVATSDGLEQLIIRGQGCMLLSATDLKEEIERINGQLAEERERLPKPGRNYLLRHADKNIVEALKEEHHTETEGRNKKRQK